MISENIKLKIFGIVSKNLTGKYQKVLYFEDDGNNVLLFCDYSSCDISIGHVFNTIKDLRSGQIFHYRIKLKKVSQEFNLPFDSVPKGHKTICNFEFLDREAKNIFLRLPHISNWHDSKIAIELS